MTELPVINVFADVLRAHGVRITSYVEYVVEYGHVPGVLSGAALKGRAKKFGASYARTRWKICKALKNEGIVADYMTGPGRPLVWHRDGKPVRVKLLD